MTVDLSPVSFFCFEFFQERFKFIYGKSMTIRLIVALDFYTFRSASKLETLLLVVMEDVKLLLTLVYLMH